MYEYMFLKNKDNVKKITIEIPYYFLEKYKNLDNFIQKEDERISLKSGDFDIEESEVISLTIDIFSGEIENGEFLNGDYLFEVNYGFNILIKDDNNNVLAYKNYSSIFYECLLPGFQQGIHEVLNFNVQNGKITNWYGKDNMDLSIFENNEIDYGDGEGI